MPRTSEGRSPLRLRSKARGAGCAPSAWLGVQAFLCEPWGVGPSEELWPEDLFVELLRVFQSPGYNPHSAGTHCSSTQDETSSPARPFILLSGFPPQNPYWKCV